MKKKDFKGLKTKTISELKALVSEKQKEVGVTYAKVKTGQEKNVSKINNLRKEIARILTLIREKEIAEEEKNKK
jgi:ribosomal protein L29